MEKKKTQIKERGFLVPQEVSISLMVAQDKCMHASNEHVKAIHFKAQTVPSHEFHSSRCYYMCNIISLLKEDKKIFVFTTLILLK